MFPIATLTGLNGAGCAVTALGWPTHLFHGMPVACLGDLAAGPAPGPIATTMHPTMLFGGRPVASMTSVVAGITPVGVPAPAPIVMSIMPNCLV